MSKSYSLKIKYILIILVITFPKSIYCQLHKQLDNANYICHYTYDYQIDSISVDSREAVDMCLYIGNTYSKFEHSSGFLRDSLLNAYSKLPPAEGLAKAMPLLMGNPRTFFSFFKIIKSHQDNSIDFYEKIAKIDYRINESIDFNWNLSSNSDTIHLGMKCQVATLHYMGRDYTAWYTTDIPISEGPYKFKGLPGLITKIEDKQKHHCFELTSFETLNYDKPILIEDRKFKEIDIDDYIKAKKADNNRLISEAPKRLKNASPERLGRIESLFRSRNNFIERL